MPWAFNFIRWFDVQELIKIACKRSLSSILWSLLALHVIVLLAKCTLLFWWDYKLAWSLSGSTMTWSGVESLWCLNQPCLEERVTLGLIMVLCVIWVSVWWKDVFVLSEDEIRFVVEVLLLLLMLYARFFIKGEVFNSWRKWLLYVQIFNRLLLTYLTLRPLCFSSTTILYRQCYLSNDPRRSLWDSHLSLLKILNPVIQLVNHLFLLHDEFVVAFESNDKIMQICCCYRIVLQVLNLLS